MFTEHQRTPTSVKATGVHHLWTCLQGHGPLRSRAPKTRNKSAYSETKHNIHIRIAQLRPTRSNTQATNSHHTLPTMGHVMQSQPSKSTCPCSSTSLSHLAPHWYGVIPDMVLSLNGAFTCEASSIPPTETTIPEDASQIGTFTTGQITTIPEDASQIGTFTTGQIAHNASHRTG